MRSPGFDGRSRSRRPASRSSRRCGSSRRERGPTKRSVRRLWRRCEGDHRLTAGERHVETHRNTDRLSADNPHGGMDEHRRLPCGAVVCRDNHICVVEAHLDAVVDLAHRRAGDQPAPRVRRRLPRGMRENDRAHRQGRRQVRPAALPGGRLEPAAAGEVRLIAPELRRRRR